MSETTAAAARPASRYADIAADLRLSARTIAQTITPKTKPADADRIRMKVQAYEEIADLFDGWDKIDATSRLDRELAWALNAAYDAKAGQPPSPRELAIVITKLEECVLWSRAGEALVQHGTHAIVDMALGIL